MVLAMCEHSRTYWDLDEQKCRDCAASSLTYPPHDHQPPKMQASNRS